MHQCGSRVTDEHANWWRSSILLPCGSTSVVIGTLHENFKCPEYGVFSSCCLCFCPIWYHYQTEQNQESKPSTTVHSQAMLLYFLSLTGTAALYVCYAGHLGLVLLSPAPSGLIVEVNLLVNLEWDLDSALHHHILPKSCSVLVTKYDLHGEIKYSIVKYLME